MTAAGGSWSSVFCPSFSYVAAVVAVVEVVVVAAAVVAAVAVAVAVVVVASCFYPLDLLYTFWKGSILV